MHPMRKTLKTTFRTWFKTESVISQFNCIVLNRGIFHCFVNTDVEHYNDIGKTENTTIRYG